MYQPWNYDPSCFEKQDHGCIVNAIHKSYTKIKTWGKYGSTRRKENIPIMNVEEIEDEFDIIAQTHFPSGYDSSYNWRNIGITIEMVKEFCEKRRNLQVFVYYKGRKIEEFLCVERNKGEISTLVLDIFGDHAMFRKDNKNGASKSNLSKTVTNDDETEDEENIPISIPTMSKAKPPLYSEWLDLNEFKIKFEEIIDTRGVKRDVGGKPKKNTNIEKSKIHVRGQGDMVSIKNYFIDLEKKHHNFEIKPFMEIR